MTIDSQCFTYIMDTMRDVVKPTGGLANEKIALFRSYLYLPGTLSVLPAVVKEIENIGDIEKRKNQLMRLKIKKYNGAEDN